jgi:hypothetical protein
MPSDMIEVPREGFDKLVERVTKLLYPPHKDLTPEQVERHYRHINSANTWNPALLMEDVNELLDELEKKRGEQSET